MAICSSADARAFVVVVVFFVLFFHAELQKADSLKNVHILSCVIQLKSVLLISCVLWIFDFNAFNCPDVILCG